MKCHSLIELFSAVDAGCEKVKLPAAHAVRDFMREQCVPGVLRPSEPVRVSEEEFVRKMRFLAKVFDVSDVPPDGCVALKEHAAYKAFSAVLQERLPLLDAMPKASFQLVDDWRFGSVLYSSAMPIEVVDSVVAKPRLICLCQTVPFTDEHLLHFLLVRSADCSPLWLGLHALQTFSVERQRRQEGFIESELIKEFFKRVLLDEPGNKKRHEQEVESYRLIFLLLNQYLGGMLVPIVESYAVTSAEALKGLVDFVIAECARAHGEPLSAAEKELRELMVRNAVLTRKVSQDKLAEMLAGAM